MERGSPVLEGKGYADSTHEATVRELEAQAARILPGVQGRGKPLFVEFAGTPKSGKTTIAQSVSLFLRRNGFKCTTIVEKASVAPLSGKRDMHFNVWTACQTLTSMLEYHESVATIVLIDRGLFDALCWTEMLQIVGEIDERERIVVQQFLMLDQWRAMVDVVFLLTTTPELALQHEFQNALTRKEGTIMNSETIEILNVAGARVADRVRSCFPVTRMDMSARTMLAGIEKVTREILSLLEGREACHANVGGRRVADEIGGSPALDLVGPEGLEPPTPGLKARRNNCHSV